MESSLQNKAIKGISWNLLDIAGVNGIRLVLGIVLARILLPEDFGLIAMVSVFFAIGQVFVDSGFGQAYVQKKEVSSADANTVFVINLSISLLLYLLLFFVAPQIANFYGQVELIKVTRVLSLVLIINSFNIIQISNIRRELNFKRKALTSLISVALSGIIGILLAIKGLGVWSLVFQQLSNRLFLTVGLYFSSKIRLKFHFSSESFRDLFSFGFWLLAANVTKKIFDNIYKIAIGKFFVASDLGFYSKSKQFQGIFSEQLFWAIAMVSFPIFSKTQDNKAKLDVVYQKFIKYSSFIIVPILAILLVVAEPFVIILLTEKWAPMIPYLQLLCVVGMIQPLYDLSSQLLQALGKSRLVFGLGMIRNVLRILNIILFYNKNVESIIIGEIIIVLITYLINSHFTNKHADFSILKQFNSIKVIFISATLCIILGVFISSYIDNLTTSLILTSLSMSLVYFLIMFLFDRSFIREAVAIGKGFINRS